MGLGRDLAAAGSGAARVGALAAGTARLLAAASGLSGLVLVIGTAGVLAGTIGPAALIRELRSLLGIAVGLVVSLCSGVAATRFSIVLHRVFS